MTRWIWVAGFYGLMVCSAQAEGHWSAESCRHLQIMKADTKAVHLPADATAWALLPILRFQRSRCGVDTTAEIQAGAAAIAATSPPERPNRDRPAARPPVLCDTTPKAYGGSYTDCF